MRNYDDEKIKVKDNEDPEWLRLRVKDIGGSSFE